MVINNQNILLTHIHRMMLWIRWSYPIAAALTLPVGIDIAAHGEGGRAHPLSWGLSTPSYWHVIKHPVEAGGVHFNGNYWPVTPRFLGAKLDFYYSWHSRSGILFDVSRLVFELDCNCLRTELCVRWDLLPEITYSFIYSFIYYTQKIEIVQVVRNTF